jgi:hypothetical protein
MRPLPGSIAEGNLGNGNNARAFAVVFHVEGSCDDDKVSPPRRGTVIRKLLAALGLGVATTSSAVASPAAVLM